MQDKIELVLLNTHISGYESEAFRQEAIALGRPLVDLYDDR